MHILFLDDDIDHHDQLETALGKKHIILHAYSADEAREMTAISSVSIGAFIHGGRFSARNSSLSNIGIPCLSFALGLSRITLLLQPN